MNHLQELLQHLRSARRTEMLITPGSEPRYKEGFDWKPLQSGTMSGVDTRTLCTTILSESQRHELIESKQICGSYSLSEQMHVRFHLSHGRLGVTGHFRLVGQTVETPQELGLPQIVTDFSDRESGVVFITAPQSQGKWTTLCSLLNVLCRQRSLSIAVVEKAMKIHLPSDKSVFTYFERGLTPVPHWFENWSDDPFKVLALDLSDESDGLQRAVKLSEKGKLVFVTLSGASVGALLNQVLRKDPSFGMALGEQLLGGLGQRLIWSTQQNPVLALEVLINTPAVKKALAENDFFGIEEIMKTSGEKTAMRTLNQSLLQNLIRRKIDIKTAFQFSPEPEELDQLLNKVGI